MRVCVIGGGAAGAAAGWALATSGVADVEVIERASSLGGVATTERVGDGSSTKVPVNDGVQGGALSYRNVMRLMRATGAPEPKCLDVAVSFGKGEHNWTNHGESRARVIEAHAKEVERFGRVLKKFTRWEVVYAFVSIERALRWHGFSKSFAERIVYPLVALFFGTGNVTASVPAAVFARVFTDPKLRLYDYCPERFLSRRPKMFAFPLFETVYDRLQRAIEDAGGVVTTRATVVAVERRKDEVVVVGRRRDGDGDGDGDDAKGFVDFRETYDHVIFACNTETSKALLEAGTGTCWMERKVFGNVRYYDDVSVTHTDLEYVRKHYEKTEGDMYLVKTYDADPGKIEMTFDLTSYQPDAAAAVSKEGPGATTARVFQTIFLDAAGEKRRAEKSGLPTRWTKDEIDPSKILLTKWWRQFGHSVRHFTRATPLWRFVQKKRRTLYAGSYTAVNTHEIAVISGLAAAWRLGAPYPFPEDALAASQFDMYCGLVHGKKRSKRERKAAVKTGKRVSFADETEKKTRA